MAYIQSIPGIRPNTISHAYNLHQACVQLPLWIHSIHTCHTFKYHMACMQSISGIRSNTTSHVSSLHQAYAPILPRMRTIYTRHAFNYHFGYTQSIPAIRSNTTWHSCNLHRAFKSNFMYNYYLGLSRPEKGDCFGHNHARPAAIPAQ
jgi:hypothetical protein